MEPDLTAPTLDIYIRNGEHIYRRLPILAGDYYSRVICPFPSLSKPKVRSISVESLYKSALTPLYLPGPSFTPSLHLYGHLP